MIRVEGIICRRAGGADRGSFIITPLTILLHSEDSTLAADREELHSDADGERLGQCVCQVCAAVRLRVQKHLTQQVSWEQIVID